MSRHAASNLKYPDDSNKFSAFFFAVWQFPESHKNWEAGGNMDSTKLLSAQRIKLSD